MAENDDIGSELAPPKKVAPNFSEIGATGLKRWSGNIAEEFLTELKMPACLKIYKEMSYNDPTIGATLMVAEQMIRRVTWGVKTEGTTSPDLQAKTFVEECMNDMSMPWKDVVSEILSMFTYGWSWHELVYKRRDGWVNNPKRKSMYSDGKIGWAKIPIRSQESWAEWKFEDIRSDELIGLVQSPAPYYNYVTVPLSKSLLFRTRPDRNNPEGRSLLRNAYRPWYFKRRIEEIEGIGVERDLAGLPVLQPPEDLDIWNPNDPLAVILKDHAEKMVRNVRRDQQEGVVLPFGWVLSLLSTGGRRQIDINSTIARYDQRIAITLLADIVLLGADKVGSFALADVKKSLLAAALESYLGIIADVFNRFAIPRLMELNPFPGLTKLPRIVPGELEVPDLRELGRYIQVLSGTPMQLFPNEELENYLLEVAGLPVIKGMQGRVKEVVPPTNKFSNKPTSDGAPNGTVEEKNVNGKKVVVGDKENKNAVQQ